MATDELERPALDIVALQAAGLPHCDWREFITVTDGTLEPTEEATLDAYFTRFLKPGPCAGCGSTLGVKDSDLMSLLRGMIGGATFEWGIAHGEGACGKCGYPARAIHYDVGPIKQLCVILQYHPDGLKQREVNADD